MGNETKNEAGVPALQIVSRPDSFCRAGRRWTHDAQVVALSEFTKVQIAALKAETNLVVTETTLPASVEAE